MSPGGLSPGGLPPGECLMTSHDFLWRVMHVVDFLMSVDDSSCLSPGKLSPGMLFLVDCLLADCVLMPLDDS